MLMYLVRRLCLFAVAAGVLGAAAALIPDDADDAAAATTGRASRPPVSIWPGDPTV